MVTQTELENRGTSVRSVDGIRSAHLSGGVGFAWNVEGSIWPLTGGGCAAPLWRLRRPLVATALKPLLAFFARGTRLEGGNRGVQKCDSVDPLSLVIKC